MKTMKRKVFWMIPVFNGIAVGLMLWAMNDFDASRVLGQWAIIAGILAIYTVAIAGIPAFEPKTETNRDWTPVQRRYVEATALTPAK